MVRDTSLHVGLNAARSAHDTDNATTLRLSLSADSDVTPEELERLTGRLREELLALDVEQVTPVAAGPAPPGAKAIQFVQLGALLVRLAKSPALLGQVVALVRGWVTRRERLTVSLEIGDAKLTLTGASDEERQRLVDAWITRALETQPAEPGGEATENREGGAAPAPVEHEPGPPGTLQP